MASPMKLPSESDPFQIAVLISGGGTTLQNLIEKRRLGKLLPEIRLVVSSRPAAAGLQFASAAGIDCRVFDHRQFFDAVSLSTQVFDACRLANIDLVVMGGFLRQLAIPHDYKNRVVNIHPSLIPAFCGRGMYGLRVHQAVVDARAPVSGCTVHFVDNEYDHGPIIAQKSVAVDGLAAEALQKKVFAAECELYPQVINAIARGEVQVQGDEVIVRTGHKPS
jgi:phosphoribosylglycinamide formyltransferase-1